MTTIKDNDPWDAFKVEYNSGWTTGFISGVIVTIIMYFCFSWIF